MDASASDPGSQPRDGQAQPGAGAFTRGRGDRRRWINRGSASRAGEGHQRRRAIAGHPAIPENDEGLGALYSAVERIEKDGNGRGREPLNCLVQMCVEMDLRSDPSVARRAQYIRDAFLLCRKCAPEAVPNVQHVYNMMALIHGVNNPVDVGFLSKKEVTKLLVFRDDQAATGKSLQAINCFG